MNFPSVERISRALNLDKEAARSIRAHMEASKGCLKGPTALEFPEPVRAWVASCYNRPSRGEIHRAAIACIITEGRDTSFEVCREQGEWKSFHDGPSWEAVNVGDPYIPTVIHRNGRYSIGCWGDLPEVNG